MQEEVKTELGGFNPLVTQERDPKTGKVMKLNPFTIIVHKGVRFYEWPKASKNLWFENRAFAGRLGDDGIPVKDQKHVAWVPKLTEDAKVGQHNQVLEKENVRLMQELSAIKAEQDVNTKLAAPAKPKETKVAPAVKK